MSKIKLLVDVAEDMHSLADSIQAVCDAMLGDELLDDNKQTTAIKDKEVKKKEKPTVKEIKLEDVRAVLAEKSQAGMTAKVREIIQKHGAEKLSEIEPKYYADILKEAEGLINE
ncbi:rRNA biogenesis protein rrp5 [Sporanaerobacter acetigenes]|uniref:rRNA biogenesis protein rrp5 n=1 Tax=Sporanaerobacter acetigenes DSM 13106 TaxID=1123281 RepID=A0A1M5YZW0_9FIRM|nr:rRNA biogenesis protein rrp5 [Sporanaerobacter acetigenes]SHI17557.1 hypothetical protein SAMN02745180_02589 [Sporanaerobacter acetigenes DSM 13106]